MKPSNPRRRFAMTLAAAACLIAAVATADRIVTVYGSGKALFTTEAANVDSIDYGTSSRLFRIYNAARKQLYFTSRSRVDSVVWSGEYSKKSFPALYTYGNDLEITYDDSTFVYNITTTDSDPYVSTYTLDTTLPADSCVLSFEYRCAQGVNDLQVFFGDPITEDRSVHCGEIPATIGTEWATFRFPIATYRKNFSWGGADDYLRLDFGSNEGVNIELRNLRIRTMTDAERAAQEKEDSLDIVKARVAADVAKYLTSTYASSVDTVTVKRYTVSISGHVGGNGKYSLADVAPYEDVTEAASLSSLTEITSTDGTFTISMPRLVQRGGVRYDRALSRWAVVRTDGDSTVLDSHARYADSVFATRRVGAGVLKGKKGIAAGGGSTYIADFDSLDVHSITQNIVLSSYISTTQTGAYQTAYVYGGHSYYINTGAIAGYDALLQAAAKKGIIVEAILLTPSGSEFRDPECTGGYYSMPNMTTPAAVNFYAAALNYLADRYTQGTYGRIHHWIMHNEVDMGETWTNMGSQPEMRFYDRYIKSMRMCYNIVRQYDQHASVLGSYTHTWNVAGTDYTTRKMLEQNVQYSAAEGDFRWGVAYHPYPIDLTKPAFWNNDRRQATFSNDARYVTFYNPEVISAWMLDPAHFYKDGTKRICFFSENGTNSPTYSDANLALQAAGAAWIWKKLQKLDGVDALQWHNWKDNRAEFGLRIGLRAFADGDFQEYDPKPVWYVWQAAGTDKEDSVFAPYLKVIGISSWDGIVQTVK